jgi:hypothetical protein
VSRHLRRWLSSGVTAFAIAGCWLGSAAGESSASSPVAAYRPVFHQLLMGGEVLASGDYTLLFSPAAPESPATLIDQHTGQRHMITVGGAGCQVEGLAPKAVVWRCTGIGTGEAPDGLFAQALPAGQITKLPFNDGFWIGGTDWLQFSFIEPNGEHQPQPRVFLNPTTGRLVKDTTRVGGRRYPDLNSRGLFKTACRPVTVPRSYQSNVQRDVPGNLSFYGSVAVKSDVGDRGHMSQQRCGSRTITQIAIPNIAVPTIITDASEAGVQINNRKLYISGPYDQYVTALPDSLR